MRFWGFENEENRVRWAKKAKKRNVWANKLQEFHGEHVYLIVDIVAQKKNRTIQMYGIPYGGYPIWRAPVVYVVREKDRVLYVGWSSDGAQGRLRRHMTSSGLSRLGQYLKGKISAYPERFTAQLISVANKEEGRPLESKLIKELKPYFNDQENENSETYWL